MRALLTSVVQLQSLVLGVGRGKQEKDAGSQHKAFWRSWGLPSSQASSWCRLLFSFQQGRYLIFRKITSFVKGDVNFQPKNNH